MTVFKGRWTARVEQEFEVDAETEEEARSLLLEYEIAPHHVAELLDIEIEDIEEQREDDV